MPDLTQLQQWTGKTETRSDTVTAVPFAALSATLDLDPALPAPGEALPPLWHWLYFLPLHRRAEIGEDEERRTEHGTGRKQQPMVGPNDQAQDVWHDEADEADRAGDRHRGRRRQRGNQREPQLGAADVEAQVSGRAVAEELARMLMEWDARLARIRDGEPARLLEVDDEEESRP